MGEEFVLQENDRGSSRNVVRNYISPPSGMQYGSGLEEWRNEISDYYQTMKNMIDMEPTFVFQNLSQFSARASEMRSLIPGTKETREQASFRLRILDPFIEECDRQFKIHSRIQAIREMDARLAGGSFA